jgi:anthranilate phosphoribosyltransferase
MSALQTTLEGLLNGVDLSKQAAAELMAALASGDVPPAVAGALLAALRAKGETVDEVAGFAQSMRSLAVRPEIPAAGAPLIDTCGTGGDGSGSLNLSTAAALLAAAAGMRVVKHGNRSISSRAGSADVLEVLGVPMNQGPTAAAATLARTGFCFLFAPRYHPAMGAVMPVRRTLGVRTVFNVLGPLSNPVAPAFQVVGAFDLGVARLMAGALSRLGLTRAFVVHGENGWDEATPICPFHLFDVRPGQVTEHVRDPASIGVAPCTAADLAGGDAKFNAAALEAMLDGAKGPHRAAATLSAGLALEVSDVAADWREGVAMATAAIDDGRASDLLTELRADSNP